MKLSINIDKKVNLPSFPSSTQKEVKLSFSILKDTLSQLATVIEVISDYINNITRLTVADIVGPNNATDNNFASFDGITGKLLKDSGKSAGSFEASGSVATHAALATTHGVNGTLVGTSDAQVISNKKYGGVAHYSEFETDGTLKFNGDATVWNDINLTIGSLRAGASAPGSFTVPGTGLILATFSGIGPQQDAYGSLEILHNYAEGTDITPHIHWCPTTTGSGNVVWQLEYSWLNGGGTITTSTTITVTVAASGIVSQETRTNFPTISGAGKTIGSRFVFHLFRNSAHASDTYAADAGTFDFGIHYQIDTVGSRNITSK